MRNADKQADITNDTGKGMVTKHWRPCTDDFPPSYPHRIRDLAREIAQLFSGNFKRVPTA